MDGSRITAERKNLGLSQEDLAEKLGVSQKSISKYERGTRRPTYETITAMANLFGVTIGYLLGNSDERSPNNESTYFFFFDNMLKDVFVSRFKKTLEARSLTLEEFSICSKISTEKCIAYFNGECEPSLEDLIVISQILGVSIDYLLGQITLQSEKALMSFQDLNEDNQYIILGDIKKYIKEQKYEESVAADQPPKKASGK